MLLPLQLELHLKLLQLGGGGARHPTHAAQLGQELGYRVHGVPGGGGEGGEGAQAGASGLARPRTGAGAGRIVVTAGAVGQPSSTMSNTSKYHDRMR